MALKFTLFAALLGAASPSIHAQTFAQAHQASQQAFENKDYAQAVELSAKAWQLGTEQFGEDSEQALKLRHSYANMLAHNDQGSDAIDEYNAVFEQYQELFGESSVQAMSASISILNTLNETRVYDERRYSMSTRIGRYLLDDIEDVSFESKSQQALFYSEAATALMKAGSLNIRRRAMVAFMDEAFELSRAAWGEDDFRTLQNQFYAAQFAELGRDKDIAINHYQEIVKVSAQAVEFTHPYELGAHARLVNLFEKRGDSEKATEHCVAIGKMKPWQPDQKPEPIYRVDPDYPVSAVKLDHDEGSVKMSFDISASGFVENIKLIKVKGGKAFAREAREALSQWRFAPKFSKGQAVSSPNHLVQLDFKLI